MIYIKGGTGIYRAGLAGKSAYAYVWMLIYVYAVVVFDLGIFDARSYHGATGQFYVS